VVKTAVWLLKSYNLIQYMSPHHLNPHLEIGNLELVLLPDRVVYNPGEKTLILADVHFGKDSHWRRLGQYAPEIGQQDLARLQMLLDQHDVKTVVIVGDLIHSRATSDFELLADFFENNSQNFILVEGNHDRWARTELNKMNLEIMPCLEILGAEFVHDRNDAKTDCFISGHEHPGYKLPGEGKLPAFVQMGKGLILPAFGSFNGSLRFNKFQPDSVWVIGEGEVVKL
jgi:DNA ligase-associated metallophosphoesterase